MAATPVSGRVASTFAQLRQPTMEQRTIEELIRRTSIEFSDESERRRFIASMLETLRRRCGPTLIPHPNESLALSMMSPKTAALAYDKVYRLPILVDPVPEEVGFYGGTLPEMVYCAFTLFIEASREVGFTIEGFGDTVPSAGEQSVNERRSLSTLTSDLASAIGRPPTIFYRTHQARETDFGVGAESMLMAAIRDIALVDESSLSWKQILEFRRDAEARTKYRRIVRWLDKELCSAEPAAVMDMIALRFDDYEWAIRKHGISTSLGVVSTLIDPKVIGAATAIAATTSVVGTTLWGALAGASIVVGKAVLTFGTTHIAELDRRRGSNYEVAYIHELRRDLA